MKKHVRETLRALQREFPGIQVELLRQKKHYVFDIEHEGRHRHLTVSVSPTNAHFVVDNAVCETRKLLKEPCLQKTH